MEKEQQTHGEKKITSARRGKDIRLKKAAVLKERPSPEKVEIGGPEGKTPLRVGETSTHRKKPRRVVPIESRWRGKKKENQNGQNSWGKVDIFSVGGGSRVKTKSGLCKKKKDSKKKTEKSSRKRDIDARRNVFKNKRTMGGAGW